MTTTWRHLADLGWLYKNVQLPVVKQLRQALARTEVILRDREASV